jgi:hypothetical protein
MMDKASAFADFQEVKPETGLQILGEAAFFEYSEAKPCNGFCATSDTMA